MEKMPRSMGLSWPKFKEALAAQKSGLDFFILFSSARGYDIVS
jgi:hypothetical protein